MPKFVAVTSPGLTEALFSELESLGLKKLKTHLSSVEFEGSWEMCYRANLGSSIATRILLPVLEFPAYKPEDVYFNVKKHDFTKYVNANGNLWVDAKVDESAIRDQRLLAMKIKDAVVDQFRDKFGERPSVNKNDGLSLYLRGYKNNFVLSVDTSSPALNKRGYRVKQPEAPLKENVAAGLLTIAGWDGEMPVVDPFCGSGTILIEAALRYMKRAPGTLRKSFSVQGLKIFQEEAWSTALDFVISQEKDEGDLDLDQVRFYGYDIDSKAIRMARENAREAGVDHLISFQRKDVVELEAPVEKGIMISNLPYGIRVGDEFFLAETYKNFAHTMKTHFKGWDVWVLSGNKDLTKHLSMRAEQRFPIINGGIDCRFIHYRVNK
ncbi:MAG: RNA methyltransferase [Bdellovibrionaceae bacterium]|nr:RNA methyltransferase [Pseudobdellovibrionaceae bacterium]